MTIVTPTPTSEVQEVETQYPFLVYGTLRPGNHNYRSFLEGVTTSEADIRLPGYRMHGRGGFPYVIEDENHTITATVTTVATDVYARVMKRLDGLEGYREGGNQNHYDRLLVPFTDTDGTTKQGWIYVARSSFSVHNANSLPVIEHGDWNKHVTESNRWDSPFN